MAKKNTDDVTRNLWRKQGARLKAEMQAHKLTRYNVCDLTHISAPGSISRYCSGVEPIPDDVFESLAAAWGVRVEYLRCDDDFRTLDDVASLVPLENRKAFKACLGYLETLGLKLRPHVTDLLRKPEQNIDRLRASGVIPNYDEIEKGEHVNFGYFDPLNDAALLIGFEMEYKDNPPRVVSINKVQDMMQLLDALASALIKDRLLTAGILK